MREAERRDRTRNTHMKQPSCPPYSTFDWGKGVMNTRKTHIDLRKTSYRKERDEMRVW
jgi:hypothetical protein